MSEKIPTEDVSPEPVQKVHPAQIDLYAKRKKIQPRAISGRFQTIRDYATWAVLAVFVLTPWLTWDGRQALLFDLPNRQFFIFGWTFLPQDFIFLSWLLIMAAFSLFMVTVLAGRVWCGYTCPQSVWTKLFMWIEHAAEGDRNARMRMDKAPWSLSKFFRRSAKHLGWLFASAVTGVSFVSYFTPVRELLPAYATLDASFWEFFWAGFFTFTTYLNAGWMREQICMYACPYGRFQSVMFDRDTLIVSYDHERGEPRGARKRTADHKSDNLGDCIDCQLCVQVCPTGIDIRNGLQFQCIACAACIDACDSIMDQMGYERGLVRYTTENALERKQPTHFVRPRTVGYAAVLAVMASLFLYTLSTRIPFAMDALRDRNMLYRENDVGMIENVYTLRIMNKSQQTQSYKLSVTGIEEVTIGGKTELTLAPGEILTLPLTLTVDPEELKKSNMEIEFHLQSASNPDQSVSTDSRFLGPVSH